MNDHHFSKQVIQNGEGVSLFEIYISKKGNSVKELEEKTEEIVSRFIKYLEKKGKNSKEREKEGSRSSKEPLVIMIYLEYGEGEKDPFVLLKLCFLRDCKLLFSDEKKLAYSSLKKLFYEIQNTNK